tara:strand:+ start:492 stop:956 length:465 start_codon:yes stop_codon:yes gene_type:complete
MILTPKTPAEKQKERITLIRNAEKAGLTYMGGNVFKDEEVYPTQYYRFCSPKSVKDFKAAIDSRLDGNKESYAVQLHDFTNIIPDEILDTIVNRRIRGYLETKIAKDMSDHNLDTSIPDNLYDPNRESNNSIRSYFTSTDYEEGAGYSYDICNW